jgi:hypothetical protein
MGHYTFRIKSLLLTFMLAFTALSLNANAANLNDTIIKKWMSSVIPIQAWAKEHQKQFLKANANKAPDMSTKGMINSLHDAGLYNEAAKEMKKYGFKSPEEWAETQHQVIQAMMALQIEAHPKSAFNPEEQLAKIKNNPNIPEAQKAKMVQLIQSTAKMMKDAKNVSAEDKAAVKPHMEEIIAAMNKAREAH